MTKATLIELEHVSKTYEMGGQTVTALKEISLKIKEGEFVAITGPSGSGKSTMMHLVGALDLPSGGHIYLAGKDISTLHESTLAELRGKKIGLVFQKFNLLPTLNALENVMLPMEFQDAKDAQTRAEKALDLVGLKDRMHHKPSELSGGQAQRVAIARAIAHNPDVILADEPTGNLDSNTGKQIMEIFERLHKEGHTIVFITHDLHLVKYAQKIVTLKDGLIVKEETQ